jgi:hypothetical protein
MLPSVRSEYIRCVLTVCVCLDLQYHSWQLHLCTKCSVRLPLWKIPGLVIYGLLCCDAMQLVPCRWAQQVSKCWYLSTMYSHGVTAHKTVIFTVTLVGTFDSLVCYMPCTPILICMYLGSFLYTLAQNWAFEWVTLSILVWEVSGLCLNPECLSWPRFFIFLLSPFCTLWADEVLIKKFFWTENVVGVEDIIQCTVNKLCIH